MATTTGYTNGQPTTALLPLPVQAVFRPAAGRCVEVPDNTFTVPGEGSHSGIYYCNIEYCFQATPYAKRNTTYYFRINRLNSVEGDKAGEGDLAYVFYRQYARLTIEDTASVPVDIYVDDDDLNTARIGDTYNAWTNFTGPLVTSSNVEDWVLVRPWAGACGSTVGAWQGGSRYNSTVAGLANAIAFRWIPNVPVAAQYNVYARWVYDAERGRNVPYSIRHANGTAEVFVNQRDPALGAKWNLLGTYTFNVGTNGWVELGGNDGVACADAVWLQRVN